MRIWKKKLFLDISSTDTETVVPSLYQCVETRTIEVFSLLSQPFPHFRFKLFVTAKRLPPSSEPLYATDTFLRKQEVFLYE
jgi:hypothetical protein